jgi:hypothetical protein
MLIQVLETTPAGADINMDTMVQLAQSLSSEVRLMSFPFRTLIKNF